ncbi:MAG: preprotein translocase subunit SecG [Acidobacteria bacterium]|nr:preprotein translocase subunit SecG [Acidobacteriota bacterium]
MFYYLFVTLYVVSCLVLMIVILLQQGKGGDIANAFGGGSSQAVFGARTGATLLTKVTAGLTVAFMSLALLLAIWGSRGTGSVVGGVDGPPPVSLPAGATDIPAQPVTPAPAATTPTPDAAPSAPAAGTTTPAPATPEPAKKQ